MSFAHYLLQVNLYLIVFFGFYKLLLDKETYFTLNRIYLVAAGVLSLSIPFIRLEWLTEQKAAQQVYTSVNWEAVLAQATIVTERNTGFNWGNAFVYIYCAGILFFLGRLVFNLLAVKKLISVSKAGSAFSFFGKKVIDQELPQMDVIDIHEEAHIKQWHTVDILFFEIIGIITWLNPVIYLYKKAIKNIHEFLADELAAEFQGDKAEYAMLLLSKSFGISPNALTNGFLEKSLIKKRIFMLHKERSKKIAIMKYGIFIPLFALLIVFSSATVRKNEKLLSITDQIPLEKPIEIVENMVTTPEKIIVAPKISVDGKTDANWKGFYQFLLRNIKYPGTASSDEVQGNAQIKFNLKGGRVINITSNVELGAGCDEEVMKAILSYKGFKTVADGKYALTVSFKIPESSEEFKNKLLPKSDGYVNLNKINIISYLPKTIETGAVKSENTDKVYDFVSIEKQPEFPGGIGKFYQYLGGSIKYPKMAQDNNVQGKVFLSFVVEKDGSLSDVQITRGLGSGTDEEAMRVIKESPKWHPGIQNGLAVRVKYNINVNFTLNTDPPKPLKTLSQTSSGIRLKSGINFNGLIILDGVKLAENSQINSINPNSIESVEVLKDQTAVSLYGNRAKDGAILITTKEAKNSAFRQPDTKELTIDKTSNFFELKRKF
ncbi:TonB family protein [Pedobacter sp. ISL-68]|uniref:M56 family metallopeptidase n=1 Tax=unclassified Pedobacter TaxID=2628915 RepID=UPI001BE809F9|nr:MULTISPECIES: M56 family metallopeptidase [unclassified Pedobacter]MBT2559726.1 TonB family protein [Pedobacter sp. ISL-64]MBT2592031.1 TonB family protein [Pedobacter sp. ISL-68]